MVVNTCAVTAEAVRQSRQAIRKLKREQSATRASSSPAAPRRPSPRPMPPCRKSMPVLGNAEKLDAEAYADFGMATTPERVRVNDIMSVRETASQMVDQFRGPDPRLPAGAEWLRPSLHLLHHPVRPRAHSRSVPMGAVVERGPPADRKGLCRNRADGRRSHVLWRGPAGHAVSLGTLVRKLLKLVPAIKRLQALVHRFHRGRCRSDARHRAKKSG